MALGLVSLILTILVVAGVAKRVDFPAPILLVFVGVGASYLPMVPEVRLTPDIVLLGLLPPLLYNAALQTSLIDFNANRKSILSLSVGLIIFTTLGVGVVVHSLLPGVGWPGAFALGAVVAPPDAVAATAVAKRVGMPRRIVTVLEGESLLNDATALVSLKTAIIAAGVALSPLEVGRDFFVTAAGGVLVGLVVYLLVGAIRKQIEDPVFDTAISLLTPFAAYLAAEEIHGSGVLAVVVAGLLLGHRAPVIQSASSRISEQLNWRTFSFLLENAVFLLIGLQTRWILQDVSAASLSTGRIAAACLATLATVMVLRLFWVVATRVFLSADARHEALPLTYALIVGWAGMRGVVTLAAAFAIPVNAPQREVLLMIALVVTAGTLVIQGLTLPVVVRLFKVPAPDPREDALARAELLQAASAAGLAELEAQHESDTAEEHLRIREVLKVRLEQRDFAAWERLGDVDSNAETPSERYARLRLDMLAAERAKVLELRSSGHIDHEVVEDVLNSLDIEESMITRAVHRRREMAVSAERGGLVVNRPEQCQHLETLEGAQARGEVPTPPDKLACVDCLEEGTTWVHLRMCLECGHVACCDSSPRRHATAHHNDTAHPVMRSVEPGESWRWCFTDEVVG